MHHYRPHVIRLGSGRLADKVQQWQRKLWDSHVRPLGVMELRHHPLVAPSLLGAALQVDQTKQDVIKRELPKKTSGSSLFKFFEFKGSFCAFQVDSARCCVYKHVKNSRFYLHPFIQGVLEIVLLLCLLLPSNKNCK